MKPEKIAGINPVKEALKAGRPLQRLLVSKQQKPGRGLQEIIKLAQSSGIEVTMVSREILNREAQGASHQGVMAFAAPRRSASLEDILGIPGQRGQAPLFLVLDGVEDPRNLGAIVRTAEVAGVHGLVIPERRAAGLTETVAKAAAGALEYVPVVTVVNIANTLEAFKGAGVWVAGAETEGDMLYWDADFVRPTALVLGGEGRGMRRLVRERCDYTVSLPQKGRIHSLNVSVAAGVLLYEVLRQRGGGAQGP